MHGERFAGLLVPLLRENLDRGTRAGFELMNHAQGSDPKFCLHYQGAIMQVADLMQKNVRTISPEASVAELVQAMADARVSGLPVVTPTGHVIGVVSATDVLQASAEPQDARARENLFEHHMVRDLMTPNPYVIQPDADVREAAKHMLYADVRRLFVEDQGRIVGVISQTDIAHAVGTGRL
jgi:CBS domain-containing protein